MGSNTNAMSRAGIAAIAGSAMVAAAMAESIDAPFLQTALEVVSRASSSSEVLSLNLTNLVILLALKVAIVAFGLFSGGATGRSSLGSLTEGADMSLSQNDMTGGMCFLLLTGGDEEKLSCVQRAACESPVSAGNYLQAAKMWYKMHKIIKVVPSKRSTRTSWSVSTMPWSIQMLAVLVKSMNGNEKKKIAIL